MSKKKQTETEMHYTHTTPCKTNSDLNIDKPSKIIRYEIARAL